VIKKHLHIFFSLLLVLTTTTSIWSHLLAHEDDPIEVQTEKETDSEEKEKEKEKELDDLEDDLIHSSSGISHSIRSSDGFLTSRSTDADLKSERKLYLLYHHLKIDC